MDFDWKETLGKVAPVIAGALGGPMAAVATKMAGDALGLGSDATQDDIASAVATGSPDVLLALKKADQEFKLEMQKLGVKLEEVHAGDRDSARDLAKTKGTKVQGYLTAVFTVAFAGLLLMIFSGQEISESMKDVGILVVGALLAEFGKMMNFWFGSSSGSKEKTAIMGVVRK